MSVRRCAAANSDVFTEVGCFCNGIFIERERERERKRERERERERERMNYPGVVGNQLIFMIGLLVYTLISKC